MSSLRDQFAHFYMLDDTIETAMTTGLAVPDANVLLDLFTGCGEPWLRHRSSREHDT
jgi:hypothetical protein